VDKPVLTRARPMAAWAVRQRHGRGVASGSAEPTGKQRIKGLRGGFQKES